MEMIERVARALWQMSERPEIWADAEESIREMCMDHARAAIEAMREPTEAMLMAPHAQGAVGLASDWRAMIDAALAPPPKADPT